MIRCQHLETKALWMSLAVACAGVAHGQLSLAQKDDIGFTSLQATLGAAMPTGDGISATMVEATVSSLYYMPDVSFFPATTISNQSGGSSVPSWHATAVGQYFYGSSSLSPDVGSTAGGDVVRVYEVLNWLQSGSLYVADSTKLPKVETSDVQNHSWVGSTGNTTLDVESVRRLDFAISRDDFVAVMGVNNGSVVQPLMATAYNGISVGLSNGNHAAFTTSLDGAGRQKPDIVVPATATSYATPTVSGAASLLIETARSTPALSNAQRHEVVKALLLNGATKDEAEFAGAWNHTTTTPLDEVYGAGELNIERSYENLVAGEYASSNSSVVGLQGWDLATSSATGELLYFFDVPAAFEGTLVATLVWDRDVVAADTQPGPGVNYVFSSSLSNLDLTLYAASGFTIGSMIDESISTVDNLEHLYTLGLASGRYALGVTSDVSTDYALAWRVDVVSVPESGTLVFCLFGIGLMMRGRRKR